jgi:AraC-like DNA-binding protein
MALSMSPAVGREPGRSAAGAPARGRVLAPCRDAIEHDVRLARVFAALDQGAASAPRRTEMARRACMSPDTLDRHFRRLFGLTYTHWVQAWRVDIAESEYRAGRAGWKESAVARRVGFGSSRRMCRAFKKVRGHTPTHGGHAQGEPLTPAEKRPTLAEKRSMDSLSSPVCPSYDGRGSPVEAGRKEPT